MKIRLSIFLLLALSCSGVAQQPSPSASAPPAKPTPPSGPLIQTAPEFSQWTVVYQYAEDEKKGTATATKPAGPDRRPRRAVTTKTKTIVHEVETDGAGQVLDMWFDGQIQYAKHSSETVWYQSNSAHTHTGDANARPLPLSGFRGMELVTVDNYAGTVTLGKDRHCLVFVPGGASTLPFDAQNKPKTPLESQPAIAYVDLDSRLPVAVRTYGETRTFHFDDPPNVMQTLPPDLSEQLKKGEEARARLIAPPPRPY